MSALTFLACWFFRLALLAVFVVASCAMATAPTLFGNTTFALEVGTLFGVGVWRVAVYGIEEK